MLFGENSKGFQCHFGRQSCPPRENLPPSQLSLKEERLTPEQGQTEGHFANPVSNSQCSLIPPSSLVSPPRTLVTPCLLSFGPWLWSPNTYSRKLLTSTSVVGPGEEGILRADIKLRDIDYPKAFIDVGKTPHFFHSRVFVVFFSSP